MDNNTMIARRMYAALHAHDVNALVDVLHPDIEGHLTAGLPNRYGGVYRGVAAMVREAWGRVDRDFDIAPHPEQYLTADDGWVIVIGRYLGTARKTGRPVDAAFVHLLEFRDGRVVQLRQVTDSYQWVASLTSTDDKATEDDP